MKARLRKEYAHLMRAGRNVMRRHGVARDTAVGELLREAEGLKSLVFTPNPRDPVIKSD